ncbi:lipopolysaccharide biosynthesis protein [Bdellovibrio bacteriovorus]|uniref:lipopolysaccharide biosynthesis protein n=1 Tax=Bdellovibrio bacteriovorus TaxID=959 RepID=UPI0035A5A195
MNILFVPILARIYTPEQYAQFGLLLSLVVVLAGAASGKYAEAISTAKRDSTANVLGEIAVRFSLLSNAAFAPLLIAIALLTHNNMGFALLSILSVFSVSLANIATQVLIRGQRYTQYTILIFLMLGLIPLLQVLFKNLPGNGLLLGACAAHLIAAIASFLLIPSAMWPTSWRTSQRVKAIATIYRSFPQFALPSFFLSTLRTRLPYFALAGLPDKQFLGLFAQTDRLLGAPTTLMTTALRPLATEALSRKSSPSALLRKYLLGQWILLIPPTVLIYKNAEPIVALLLGPGWGGAAQVLKIMLFPSFLMMTTTWLDRFYDFSKQHHIVFKTEIAFGVLALLALIIWGPVLNKPIVALSVFSAITSIYYLAWTCSLMRVYKIPWKNIVMVLSALGSSILLWMLVIPTFE